MAWNGPIVGAHDADTKYHTSQFPIEKVEGPGTRQRAHSLRYACPRPHVPFHCSAWLYYTFLCSREPVRSDPSYIWHQQNLTLLAGVLMSTYWTCSLPQVIRKENPRKPGKLGPFLIDGLQSALRLNLPHPWSCLPWPIISHLQDVQGSCKTVIYTT